MATITGFNYDDDAVVGTNSDDTFIYDPSGNGEHATGETAPSGLEIDGRDGIDTVDFQSADNGALLGAYTGLYDSSTGVATFNTGGDDNTFTSIELIKFENGTLDLSDPENIAGQTFVNIGTYGTYDLTAGKAVFEQVDTVYTTVEGTGAAAGTFDVAPVDADGESGDLGYVADDWTYTEVNGEAISAGGVVTAQGTFTVVGGALNFVATESYLDSLAGTAGETFTVEVTLADDDTPTNTVTATYTITVPGTPFVFTAGDDAYVAYNDANLADVLDTNGVLDGLAGDDFISGSAGGDMIFGGAGNDTIYAGNGGVDTEDDTFAGGAGDDVIGGGDGDDLLIGDSTTFGGDDYGDLLADDSGNDVIFGGAGKDEIYTGSLDGFTHTGNGTDEAWGGAGQDEIYGDDGDDLLAGGADSDYIEAGAGDDVVYGGADDASDEIYGDAGADSIYGGGGNDELYGDGGNDVIYGGDGSDEIEGGTGADELYGGKGTDYIMGGDGGDTITGGEADGAVDYMTGDSGADTFVINAGDGADVITDFSGNGQQGDLIDLGAFGIDFATVDGNAYQVTDDAVNPDGSLAGGSATFTIIELDANTSIALQGVGVADLSASDFIF